jgi:hypothetical protein
MTDEPDSENRRFSLPMKMRVACASRAASSTPAIASALSSSSRSSRTRSISPSAVSSSKLAWPRTTSTGRCAIHAPHREATLHQIGTGGIERAAPAGDLGADRGQRLAQRAPASAR